MEYNYHNMIIQNPFVGVNINIDISPSTVYSDDIRRRRWSTMLPDLRTWFECIRNKSNIMSQNTEIEVMERSNGDSETRKFVPLYVLEF